jgi:hypothetical protein
MFQLKHLFSFLANMIDSEFDFGKFYQFYFSLKFLLFSNV